MSHPQTSSGDGPFARRFALLLLASVACLTLVFSAEDYVRRRAMGGTAPVDWSRILAGNALDWVVWGSLVPAIVLVGGRIRLDGTGNHAARIGGWVLLALAFCTAQSVITGLVIRAAGPQLFGLSIPTAKGGVSLPLGRFLAGWGLATSSFNLLIFIMTAGVFHAALYYRDLRARQLREADLEGRLARAELNVLRMQLQPHFLFNALHTVSSLMVTDVATAQRVVTALGDLLRSSLDHTARHEIPLRDELAFVGRFLDIQQARFRSRLSVEVLAPEETLSALVPSLVLQPLVENAIRHGIEPQAQGGRIWISAERRGDQLSLTVRDSGSATNGKMPGGGIGLSNIESRLAQLYGPAHHFCAARNASGEFEATLTLPFHTDATLFPARVSAR